MQYTYTPHGVCSRMIQIDVEDGIVEKVQFIGGCSGNTQGISALVQGMPVDEVIKRLENIKCGSRPTSCPDQLAKALKKVAAEQ
ncbi:MAG: TIGR03905 family TSCPD domain-containing protein [Ruminococcus sp.]|uniref:TIGR03905 family TSCPD domain-containing protein n=1 Tax=uncultured Ruminococcus sp. TaxID=165186 RepID=UPI0026154136|nr:TIGR03905 family TSCPD domain-containing protein [uncultured Ruminococcus sp.]